MTNSFNRVRKWTEQKNVSIPSLFFKMYKEIGIHDDEALILLHLLAFQLEDHEFPTPAMLEERCQCSQNEISVHLQHLIQKGLLELKQDVDANGIVFEKFSLYPVWERILSKLEQQETVQNIQLEKIDERSIFTMLEQELGRLLSPIEIETVSMWMDQDQHTPEIIKEAIKEAVLAGKSSLRYIDRILFEWKKKKLKTVDQVHQHSEKFRQHTIKPNAASKQVDKVEAAAQPKSGFYNWLDERE